LALAKEASFSSGSTFLRLFLLVCLHYYSPPRLAPGPAPPSKAMRSGESRTNELNLSREKPSGEKNTLAVVV